MHFRNKIMITYSVLVLSLAFIVGITYKNYNVNRYEKKEYDNLTMMTEKISQQFEETVKPMEFISEYLLSDVEVLDALVTLTMIDPNSELKSIYVKEAKKKIQLKLNSYYIIKNFYRVLVYNSFGEVVASENYGDLKINESVNLADFSWLPQARGKKGKPVLIGVHEDDWGINNKQQVFSVVKEIQGMSMGYIEVQKEISGLKGIFFIERDDVGVVAIQSNGEILYSSLELTNKEKSHYVLVANNVPKGIGEYENPINHETEVISSLYSDVTKVTVLLIENKKVIRESVSSSISMTVFFAICVLLASFLYIIIASSVLTKPIRQLKYQMEKTRLETLEEEVIYDKSNDEIAALSEVYQKMLTRLNEAIIKERKRSVLQLQAQYDTLQAQVNPHFLYNVLNVISYRGVKNNDEVICDMCYNLASMLRYSTNNRERESKIADEIDYLERYFYLLKMRYEHKLEYTIMIEESITNQIIPKIVLQQLVENSINHGFDNIDEVMKIRIIGWQKNNWWYVKVSDNGQGLSDEIIKKLEKKMSETKELLINGEGNIELEIGGMGLISTYARLLLVYDKDLVFTFSSNKNGTDVTIGAPMREEKEIGNVSSNCCR